MRFVVLMQAFVIEPTVDGQQLTSVLRYWTVQARQRAQIAVVRVRLQEPHGPGNGVSARLASSRGLAKVQHLSLDGMSRPCGSAEPSVARSAPLRGSGRYHRAVQSIPADTGGFCLVFLPFVFLRHRLKLNFVSGGWGGVGSGGPSNEAK